MSDQISIVEKAVSSLGKGFDLASDFRLKYCKGNERLILLNDADKRELKVPGFGAIDDVSTDIKVDKGDRIRYQSDILNFNQMSEFFNQKSAVTGKIPSGMFNSMFGFQSGSWATDAGEVKSLGLDGHFLTLFNVHIDRYPLVLSDQVRNAVPSSWDPCALASFIEKYGTHIVVGLSIGGEDVVLVKQDNSSNLVPSQLKKHLQDLGDQLFTGTCSFSPLHSKSKEHRQKVPQAFNVFNPEPIAISSFVSMNTKDGLTVICSKRGGDPTTKSHCEWLLTVPSSPDAINFSFIPITSLLKGVPGKGFLSHAINLYLRYKPPIADLQYFLDFQSHKIWAPIYNDLPLAAATNRSTPSPSIRFNLMGPKLYINTNKVLVGKKPVTGMRFYLEGMKSNRLAIHLQHLSNTPMLLQDKIVVDHDTTTTTWQGSEDIANHEQYLELINKKKSSAFICTAPVVYDSKYTSSNVKKDHTVPFIVTGAQLVLKKQESKTVLHLRLSYSKVSHFSVVQSTWKECSSSSSEFSQRTSSSSFFSTINQSFTGNQDQKDKQPAPVIVDSGVFPTGPPEKTKRLLRFVDTSHMCKGPQDNPGHWLVTGARLNLDSCGKIGLHVKFSLLNIGT